MTDAERDAYEALLTQILSLRTSDGMTPGISCAERCQLCGTVRAWSGLIVAWATHHGVWNDLVCGRCQGPSIGRRMYHLLDRSPSRFCEDCGTRVPCGPESRHDRFWVCGDCWTRHGREAADGDAAASIRLLRQRRYVAIEHPTLESLRRFARQKLARLAAIEATRAAWRR